MAAPPQFHGRFSFQKKYSIIPAEADRAIAACAQIDPSMTMPSRLSPRPPDDPKEAGALRAILTPRHPSQLYEAFLEGIVLFAILWFVRTRTSSA